MVNAGVVVAVPPEYLAGLLVELICVVVLELRGGGVERVMC